MKADWLGNKNAVDQKVNEKREGSPAGEEEERWEKPQGPFLRLALGVPHGTAGQSVRLRGEPLL